MVIYGLQKVTLLDYPGEVAATIFTFGCNMRCPFCHNPELVIGDENNEQIEWDDIFSYLQKRRNVLGGVCITGGEPLLQNDLPQIIKEIQSIGLKVKLDTNGTLAEKLKVLKPDYIAMDIKTSLEKYHLLGYNGNEDLQLNILESIKFIINSSIDHEFRTTVVPEIVDIEDIKKITVLIKDTKKYYLSQFRPEKVLDCKFNGIIPYKIEILEKMKESAINAGINCELRSNY